MKKIEFIIVIIVLIIFMKKGNNNNIFPPYLLNFWINKDFKDGLIIRRGKKNIRNVDINNDKDKDKIDTNNNDYYSENI